MTRRLCDPCDLSWLLLQLTHTIWERVEVKGGSQPPLSATRMEKSMVVQMIIHVGDQDKTGYQVLSVIQFCACQHPRRQSNLTRQK